EIGRLFVKIEEGVRNIQECAPEFKDGGESPDGDSPIHLVNFCRSPFCSREKFIVFPIGWIVDDIVYNSLVFLVVPNYVVVKPALPAKRKSQPPGMPRYGGLV